MRVNNIFKASVLSGFMFWNGCGQNSSVPSNTAPAEYKVDGPERSGKFTRKAIGTGIFTFEKNKNFLAGAVIRLDGSKLEDIENAVNEYVLHQNLDALSPFEIIEYKHKDNGRLVIFKDSHGSSRDEYSTCEIAEDGTVLENTISTLHGQEIDATAALEAANLFISTGKNSPYPLENPSPAPG